MQGQVGIDDGWGAMKTGGEETSVPINRSGSGPCKGGRRRYRRCARILPSPHGDRPIAVCRPGDNLIRLPTGQRKTVEGSGRRVAISIKCPSTARDNLHHGKRKTMTESHSLTLPRASRAIVAAAVEPLKSPAVRPRSSSPNLKRDRRRIPSPRPSRRQRRAVATTRLS